MADYTVAVKNGPDWSGEASSPSDAIKKAKAKLAFKPVIEGVILHDDDSDEDEDDESVEWEYAGKCAASGCESELVVCVVGDGEDSQFVRTEAGPICGEFEPGHTKLRIAEHRGFFTFKFFRLAVDGLSIVAVVERGKEQLAFDLEDLRPAKIPRKRKRKPKGF